MRRRRRAGAGAPGPHRFGKPKLLFAFWGGSIASENQNFIGYRKTLAAFPKAGHPNLGGRRWGRSPPVLPAYFKPSRAVAIFCSSAENALHVVALLYRSDAIPYP